MQAHIRSKFQHPGGFNPLIKNPMVELQHEWFAFTIVESHIGWALMKNKEYAVDRMNWLRLFS